MFLIKIKYVKKNIFFQNKNNYIEFRQTPYQRFSDNKSPHALTYEEKRKKWKADFKQRLRGPKIPARTIKQNNTLNKLITKQRMKGYYYVTYDPQTRLYQVSRQRPKNVIDEKLNVIKPQ